MAQVTSGRTVLLYSDFFLNVSDGNRMNMAIRTIKLSLSSNDVEMNTKLWQEIMHEKAR